MKFVPSIDNHDKELYDKICCDYKMSVKSIFSYLTMPLCIYMVSSILFWGTIVFVICKFDFYIMCWDVKFDSTIDYIVLFLEIVLQLPKIKLVIMNSEIPKILKINSDSIDHIERNLAKWQLYFCLSSFLKEYFCFMFFLQRDIIDIVPFVCTICSLLGNLMLICYLKKFVISQKHKGDSNGC